LVDVFISYKRENRAVAEAVAHALEDAGFSCWWDTSLIAGEHFNEAIQRQLDGAQCVVVLWTEASHASQWVQAEAISGFNRGALVCARLDDVTLRYPFQIIQTADLRGFANDPAHSGIQDVVRGVAAKVGRPARQRAAPAVTLAIREEPQPPALAREAPLRVSLEEDAPAPRRPPIALIVAGLAVLASVAAAAWLLRPAPAPGPEVVAEQPAAPAEDINEEESASASPAPPRVVTAETAPVQSETKTGPAPAQTEPQASAPAPPAQRQSNVSARGFNDCADADWCPQMVSLPGGRFMMGAPGRQRAMQVGAFAIGAHEVTFAQWQACVMGGGCTSNQQPRDAGWGRGTRPVIAVSWREAQEYVQWLSRETGRAYRLPSEAEWEYAARGGTTTQWPWGADPNEGCAYANFRDMAMNPRAGVTCSDGVGEMTAPVASYLPNPFGLYDMHGNVFEWVQDCRPGSSGARAPDDGAALERADCTSRVIRGGAWNYSPESSTSSYTRGENQNTHSGSIGFRVAVDAR